MSRFLILTLLAPMLLSGCQTVTTEKRPALSQTARFLLTFDDGPSARRDFNTTAEILDHLETNDVQPEIKALFFVQTRNPDGGGTALGQALLRYTHATGHVLGLHSGTERGHIRHTKMTPGDLAESLRNGRDDLRRITGRDTEFIRPTFWGYSDATLDLYTAHHLKMLLTDVNTRDGVRLHNLFGFRSRVYNQLVRTRQAIERGELPIHRGNAPVVITLHDLNTITARNVREYLHVLTEEAAAAGLPLADKPFYDSAGEIREVAALRAVTPLPATLRQARKSDPASPENPASTRRSPEASAVVRTGYASEASAVVVR